MLADWDVTPAVFVVEWCKSAVGSNSNVAADVKTMACIEYAARIDDGMGANDQIPNATGRLDFHEGINDRMLANDDVGATCGVLDIRQCGYPGAGVYFDHMARYEFLVLSCCSFQQ